MAPYFGLYIVCSDQHRNGKTLLARALVDALMLEDRDPFAIDLNVPDGTLRGHFPGRTALADFSHVTGQMRAFDTIMAAPGRDYVIDVPVEDLPRFCDAARSLRLIEEARRAGLRIVVFFIVDRAEESLRNASHVEAILAPDLFVPVRNMMIGSALPGDYGGLSLTLPVLDPELRDIISNRRFSLRAFFLGDESAVPLRLRANLRAFLHAIIDMLRDVEPALSLQTLRR